MHDELTPEGKPEGCGVGQGNTAAIEVMPAEVTSDADVEQVESKASELFAKATTKLGELLEDEDPNIALKAAAKLVDLQIAVYRMRKTQKRPVVALDKLFDDGFTF